MFLDEYHIKYVIILNTHNYGLKTHFPFLSQRISIAFIAPVNIPFIFCIIFMEIKWIIGTIGLIKIQMNFGSIPHRSLKTKTVIP